MKPISTLFAMILLRFTGVGAQQWERYVPPTFEEIRDINLVSMNCIFQCRNNRIWIGSEGGIYQYDGYRISPWFFTKASIRIDSICEDSNGDLYFFREGDVVKIPYQDKFDLNFKGLDGSDAKGRSFQRKSHNRDEEKNLRAKVGAETARFNCALQYKNEIGRQGIYIGSDDGLFYWNERQKTPDTLIPDVEILDLMEDATGALWVVSNDKIWINRWRVPKENAPIAAFRINSKSADRSQSVREITPLRDGRFLILREKGPFPLATFDNVNGSIPRNWNTKFPERSKLNALAVLPDGSVLVGGRRVLFRIKEGEKQAKEKPWISNSKDDLEVVSLKPFNGDPNSWDYLGAVLRDGLYRYSNFRFRRIPVSEANRQSLKYAYHIQPVKGEKNQFWVGSLDDGLFKVEVRDSVRILEKHLPGMKVVTASYDSDSTAWVGLFGSGLLYYNFRKKEIAKDREFNPGNSNRPLPGYVVYSIWDRGPHLVFYTNKGLCFLREKQYPVWFGMLDGLPHEDGNGEAFYADENIAYFGTIGGLARVDANTLLSIKNAKEETFFAGINVESKYIPYDKDKILPINGRQKTSGFSLYIPVSDFRFPEEEKFKILVEGSDREYFVEGGSPYPLPIIGDTLKVTIYKHRIGEWQRIGQASPVYIPYTERLKNYAIGAAIFLLLAMTIWLIRKNRKRRLIQRHTQSSSDILLAAILRNYNSNTDIALKVIQEVFNETGLNQPVIAIGFPISNSKKINIPFYLDGENRIKGEIFGMDKTLELQVLEGKEVLAKNLGLIAYKEYRDHLKNRYPEKSGAVAFFPLFKKSEIYAALLLYFHRPTKLTQKQLIALRMIAKHLPSMITDQNFSPAEKFYLRLTNEGGDAACHFDRSTVRPQHYYPIYHFLYSSSKRGDEIDEKLHFYYKVGNENIYWDNHIINRALKSLTYRSEELKELRRFPLGAIWLAFFALFERFGNNVDNPFLKLYQSYWYKMKDPHEPNSGEIRTWYSSDFRKAGISRKTALARVYNFANALFFNDTPPFQSNLVQEKCSFDDEKGLVIVLRVKDTRKMESYFKSFMAAPPREDQIDGHLSGRALYWLWDTIPGNQLNIIFSHENNSLTVHFRFD